jgi:beta-lactam-binding protein with PASTA domain
MLGFAVVAHTIVVVYIDYISLVVVVVVVVVVAAVCYSPGNIAVVVVVSTELSTAVENFAVVNIAVHYHVQQV